MDKEIEGIIPIIANTLGADAVVLYIEETKNTFVPKFNFNLGKCSFKPLNITKDESGVLKYITEKWPKIFVTSDEKILQSIPYRKETPKSFLCIPFKLGRRRAILCADSLNRYSFTEKEQKIFADFLDFIKQLFRKKSLFTKNIISQAKFNLLKSTIDIFFSEALVYEKFQSWCEVLGVDYGIFFKRSHREIVPYLVYKKINLPTHINITPRSLVFISLEREETFIFYNKKDEPWENFSCYGIITPVEHRQIKGALFLGSENPTFFSPELEDVIKTAARIMGAIVLTDTEKALNEIAPSASDFLRHVRITCSRAGKQGTKVLVLLVKLTDFSKLREKKGFWETENIVEDFLEYLKRNLKPNTIISRLSDNTIAVLTTLEKTKEEKKIKELILKEYSNADLSFLLYPDEIRSIEEIEQKIAQITTSKTRRFFV